MNTGKYREEDTYRYLSFEKISKIPGVCSAMTISGIDKDELKKLSKKEFIQQIIKKSDSFIRTDENYSEKVVLYKIKTIVFTLNVGRFWHWFTPFKYAYSYKGNTTTKARVFYINVE